MGRSGNSTTSLMADNGGGALADEEGRGLAQELGWKKRKRMSYSVGRKWGREGSLACSRVAARRSSGQWSWGTGGSDAPVV